MIIKSIMTDEDRKASVSYTHLDVYKRQEEGLELRRQSLQNGRMYHWILSKVFKMAEGQ